MIDLVVVLISRNQEWNMVRLIQSVLDGTSFVPSREVVLVDSASTDGTVGIACRYPITILRLEPDQSLSASAGRYVGYWYTAGKFVLFLDGDMELCTGWLEKALKVVRSRPDVAVVTGPCIDLPKTTGVAEKVNLKHLEHKLKDEDVSMVGGAALYRRSVLEQVGTFNPWLHSDEEPELCIRIRHHGYRILKIGHPIAYHYSDPSEAISTAIRRRRRKLYLGFGQSLRYHIGSNLLWSYLRERGYGCIPALGLVLGAVSFVFWATTGRWLLFIGWCFLLFLALLATALKKRCLYKTMYSLINRLFVIEGMARGFLLTPLDPAIYPSRFDVVRGSVPGKPSQEGGGASQTIEGRQGTIG